MAFLDLTTDLGGFRIELLNKQAPATCDYFINAVRDGALDSGCIFRIVSSTEHDQSETTPIDVVQVGTLSGLDEERTVISHEHTNLTGLLHQQWTVSAARYRPGELYKSFFVCLRREPTLDFGGKRHEDGQGFAAFGRVVSGFDVISNAHHQFEESTCLQTPINISSIRYHPGEAEALV